MIMPMSEIERAYKKKLSDTSTLHWTSRLYVESPNTKNWVALQNQKIQQKVFYRLLGHVAPDTTFDVMEFINKGFSPREFLFYLKPLITQQFIDELPHPTDTCPNIVRNTLNAILKLANCNRHYIIHLKDNLDAR
jgi:hypothetical protein